VARDAIPELAGELSALLSRLDAAVRAKMQASRPGEIGTRPELRHVVAAALRWFTHAAGLTKVERASSTHAKSRAPKRDAF
jgi:hypothetical protein